MPYIEQKVEETWNKQQAKAKQQGYDLWDAEGYRLNGFSVNKDTLLLEIAEVSYRVHSAMKELYKDPEVHEANFDKLIAADALIKTSDGMYILAQVDKVAEQEVVLIGGSCTKKRLRLDTAQDLFHFLMQRVADVLSIPKSAIEPPMLKGIIQNELGYVNLIFFTQLSLSSKAVLERFTPNSGVRCLVFVKETEAKEYFGKAQGYIRELVKLV